VAEPRGWVQRSAGAVEGYELHLADNTGTNGIEGVTRVPEPPCEGRVLV
jgi:hypothetical protein